MGDKPWIAEASLQASRSPPPSQTSFAQGQELKLGVLGPVTGPNAAFGKQLTDGAAQAVADLNAKGGILGRRITIVTGDDASVPAQGVSVANKLTSEGVRHVVGPFNSGVMLPASEIYAENGAIMITPSATNPKITERGLWNVFRTCGRDDQQGAVAADYIAKNFQGKKVAVIHDKTPYGQGLASETQKAMNAKGVKEVMFEGVNVGEKDFSALIHQDQGGRRRPRLLGRPAYGRRPDRPPDARPAGPRAADVRRRHHVGRVRDDRGPGRRRHAHDLPA